MSRLVEKVPHIGKNKANEYTYFDYYNTCADCTLIFSVEGFDFSKDVDLYVNFGSSKGFPTKEKNDFASEEWTVETLTIKPNEGMFAKKRSMKGLFLIAVSSEVETSFMIQVESLEHEVEKLHKHKEKKIT